MSYILTLTTESYLLTGSGEGGVLIDADVVFHATGFPMIPARRVKGMLKESLEEVLEISGKSEDETKKTIDRLFGESAKPTYEGMLLFHNLMLPDWEQIIIDVANHPECYAFIPGFIKTYFTAEIQQTAIGREEKEGEIEGVAKKRSLRNYRVIKPGFSFQGLLETTESLTPEDENFLTIAVRNLRNAGTRRNRGFGKVKCELKAIPEASNNVNSLEIEVSQTNKLAVTITTQAPVVIAKQLGEQNTVFTQKYITGNQLRGLLANAFIREKKLSSTNAHLNKDFFEIFLSGKVHFGSLAFCEAQPIPLHLHTYKLDKSKNPISVFAKKDEDYEITKSVGGIGSFDGSVINTNGFTPSTTFNFHNSRNNRAAGRSTENDTETGIFYYESLNEGQTFHGEITGDPALIANLLTVLSDNFSAKLGRSRSAQYGSVVVKLSSEHKTDAIQSFAQGLYVLTLQSPMILLNTQGHPSPTVHSLSSVLGNDVNIENAAATFTYVEQFNAVWQAKSEKIPAFKEGSSFLLRLSQTVSIPSQLGEWLEQGFGGVKIEPFQPEAKYILLDDKNKDEGTNENIEQQKNQVTVYSAVLEKIIISFEDEKNELGIKSKAIADADSKKYAGVKNHLIGRVEAIFQQASAQEDIDEWIKALFRANSSGKPAAEALINAGILVEVSDREYKETGIKAKFLRQVKDDLSFELTRTYWITFFQSLRKINKKNGKQ